MTKGQDRTTHKLLTMLIEDEPFQPLLDPLTEQEFNAAMLGKTQLPTVTQHEAVLNEDTGRVEPSAEEKQTMNKTRKRLKAQPAVRRPVTPSEQLDSELWATHPGFCR